MKKWLVGMLLWGALTCTVLRAEQQNPPPEGDCLTNWCQIVHCPAGRFFFTNIVFWPDTNVCAGAQVLATPNMGSSSDEAITVCLYSPQTTNCTPPPDTNTVYPQSVTNWWIIPGPGFEDSGEGLGINFIPTNCGPYTVTFHQVWTVLPGS